jgi:hypothetical protein
MLSVMQQNIIWQTVPLLTVVQKLKYSGACADILEPLTTTKRLCS